MVAIEIPFRDALALRRLVLRPEAVSDEATMYDEELAGTASTYGVLVDRFLVAIGTVMPDRHPSNPRTRRLAGPRNGDPSGLSGSRSGRVGA